MFLKQLNVHNYLFLISLLMLLLGCKSDSTTISNLPLAVIPQPLHVEKKIGQFLLDENINIVLPYGNKTWNWIGNYLLEKLKLPTGYQISIGGKKQTGNITFENSNAVDHPEGYELVIDPYEIIIRSNGAQGAFYAIQTLLQLFPNAIFNTQKTENIKWVLPCIHIVDEPRFPYRGLHLDVSRHFFNVEEVKRYIDLLVLHKMNRFHWHLTEDQGWRIEIKKYPKLTEIGAFRNETLVGHYNDKPRVFDGQRYGGFYTQNEIREVVEYANKRFVTIIPEIEMPGHAQAALAAYPALGCTGEQLEVMTKWGISENVFCPSATTFEFLENVLLEVIGLFPGKYIHIGGDECPKTKWKESAFCQLLIKKENLKDEHELQSYFIRRIEKFLNSKGREIIGWDEILEGGLAPNATVMSWRGTEGGIKAARSGHDVIMTPTSNCYLDYYQSDHPDEPLAIGGFLPLKKVYEYEPVPDSLSATEAKHILGTQGNVWTEYIKTFDHVEYMAYPRACAIAEIGWSSNARKDFKDFVTRLTHHMKRFSEMDVNAANHLFDLEVSAQPTGNIVEVILGTVAPVADIYYTTDGSSPTNKSIRYNNPIAVKESITLKAQAYVNGEKKGRNWERHLSIHKAAGKSVTLTTQPSPYYSGGGNGSLINGIAGSDERYGDEEWLGFWGDDFEAVIDLGKTENINEVSIRFFNGEGQWIYLPKFVQIFSSDDGQRFNERTKIEKMEGDSKTVIVTIPIGKTTARYFKIFAKNYGMIPDGKQGAGNEAWIFIDEIVFE